MKTALTAEVLHPLDRGKRFLPLANIGTLPEKDRRKKRVCRLCEKPIPSIRRVYCSTECSDTGALLCYVNYQRYAVCGRDHGVCALCGCDTVRLHNLLLHVSRQTQAWTLRRMGFINFGSLWDMDHDPPISMGGGVRKGMSGAAVLDGLRTLCQPCHKDETRKLKGELAKIKAEARGFRQLTFDGGMRCL